MPPFYTELDKFEVLFSLTSMTLLPLFLVLLPAFYGTLLHVGIPTEFHSEPLLLAFADMSTEDLQICRFSLNFYPFL